MAKIPPKLLGHMRRWRAADRRLEARLQRELDDPDYRLNAILHHGGRPLTGRPRRSYASIVADAGLPAEVTPHWHRHTAATWLMENGCDLWEAAGYLGMNPTTLQAHYGHHRPDHQAGPLKAMGGRRR